MNRITWLVASMAALAMLAALPAHAAEQAPVSIADLIANAYPGDTIDVPAGTYLGQLVITKPVSLVGHGRPVIDGQGKGDVVDIRVPGVSLRGFIVQGSASAVSDEPAGIRVSADNAHLEDNELRDVLYGIVLQNSNGHTVRNNTIASMPQFGAERRGHGIYLWHTSDNLIEANAIRLAKDGLFVGFSSRNTILRNTVTESRYGIHYMYSDDNSFEKNRFYNDIAGGVLMYSSNITFSENEFSHNLSTASGYGLLFKDVDNVEVDRNLIHHNRLGITMEGAPHSPENFVTVKDNLIAYNQIGIEMATTTQVTFTGNSFLGNLEQVVPKGGDVAHQNVWSLDGRGNYWDEYTGYDASGDGIGDLPFSYDGGYDALVQQNPALKAFAYTPARTALDLAGSWFPAFKPEARLVDDHPLMSPSITLGGNVGREARIATIVAAFAMIAVPVAAMMAINRRFGRWSPC